MSPVIAVRMGAAMWGDGILRAGLRQAVGEVLFERFDHGVLVTDAAGAVIETNAAARRMIAACDGLSIQDGRIAAHRRADTIRLRAAIAELGQRADPRPDVAARRSLLIARPGPRKPYSVVLSAERLSIGPQAPPTACVLAAIVDLAQRSVPDPAWLREAFGLTDREASLAAAITEGAGLASAARRLGVGLATARSHLAAVFLKTETRRQAELTRLVCEAAAPLAAVTRGAKEA
jgi:DNA-binding CsgD family transcriptional regulator